MNQIASPQTLAKSPISTEGPEFEELLAAIAAGASQRDRQRDLPYEAVALIRAARLGALRVEVAAGGGGVSNRTLFAAIIRLGEADSNVAHILRNHFSFVERFARNKAGAPYDKWKRALADGAIFGLAYGELETRQVGSREVITTLTADPDGGYRLNGTKYYSTGSLYADYILVRAKAEDDSIANVVVPANREGVELLDDWDGFGQRLTATGTTILRNVRVEADEVVHERESVFAQPYTGAVPQLILTAVNAGILRAILRDAAALVRGRGRSFVHASAERPADDPLLQQTVGVIAANAFAAEATIHAAADGLDRLDQIKERGLPDDDALHEASLLASKAKVVIDELAIRSASLLLDVGGASATKQTQNLDRHWRNARTLASHNPAAYKARAVGDHVINGTKLPEGGFF